MGVKKENSKAATKSAENETGKKNKYKKRKKTREKEAKRQSKYDTNIRHKLKLVYAWKRRGLSDEEIAANLGVAYSTFKVYKSKYEELSAALSAGAHEAVLYVENALFEKSCGIREEVLKPIKVKKVFYDERTGKKIREEEQIEYGVEQVYIPPETNAAKFYLVNRAPNYWKEHVEAPPEKDQGGLIFIPKRSDE